MSTNKKETLVIIKPAYDRSVSVDEKIYSSLSMPAFSLYMAFRFQADFKLEDSEIKRSARFLYETAKIKRTQYYICLNELEEQGLVLRDPESKLGEKCIFHVAKQLGFFSRGVRVADRGVRMADTYQESLSSNSINTITSVSDETNSSKIIDNQEIIEAYHEHMPDMTRIKAVDRDLANKIRAMQKNWPKYQREGKKFTLELFIAFLSFVKANHVWFIKPYTTESGNTRKNSLRNLITEKNLAKFANGEFSAC